MHVYYICLHTYVYYHFVSISKYRHIFQNMKMEKLKFFSKEKIYNPYQILFGSSLPQKFLLNVACGLNIFNVM